ncbi:class I adenylate-forming enzyme family protein [Pseudomonas sp. Irchel s3a18]|uniref:class I adenylate-forming enzyme family protein n=1 Tax=Pseudomonas sp. Irchel s3a18 TaxID=2009053 RepID=UPI000BA45747|nr:class I adenylate-forming enzyme family protein [Pseudomonas sp. Irchel s3a18]
MLNRPLSALNCVAEGMLPQGDPRLGAHTLQHLVLAMLRDRATGLIRDVDGVELAVEQVDEVVAQLTMSGVVPGDVVVVKARNDLGGVASILGVWALGCALCPVDPSGAQEVHAAIVEQSGAKAIVGGDGSVTAVERVCAVPLIELRNPRVATGEDLGLIIFTSGSSGSPKGVLLTHSNVLCALRAITAYLGIGPCDRILCIPPMFLDYGVYQVLFAMFARTTLYLGSGVTNPLRILEMIKSCKPTIIPVVPALASGLARVLNTFGSVIEGVRIVTNTGGHLAPSSTTALQRAFPGVQVVPMYGLTESKRALFLPAELVESKPGSVGGPMPGLDARVVIADKDGQLVEAPDNVDGELYVRGASVMQGYHSPAAAGGARLIPGHYRDDNWLATGDLFVRDEDGCLFFRGRSKALIKQRGYCLYPRDLEAAAEATVGVESSVVVGRTEPDGDESAVLFAVTNVAGDDAAEAALRDGILAQLHPTIQPRLVKFLKQWPASPVGKIDLNKLRIMAEEL